MSEMSEKWWKTNERERYEQFRHSPVFLAGDINQLDSENWKVSFINKLNPKIKYNWRVQQPNAPMNLAAYIPQCSPDEFFEQLLMSGHQIIGDYQRGFNPAGLSMLVSKPIKSKQAA